MTSRIAAGRRWIARHYADPLYRQSYLTLLSTGVSAGSGLLFWVVAARRADPTVLGTAAGLFAANSFLSYLTGFGLPYAMLRYGATHVRAINPAVAFSAVTSFVAALAFAALAPVVSPDLAPHLRAWWPDVVLFAVAGVGAGVGVLVDNLLTALRRAGTALARNTAAGVLKLVPLAWLPADDPGALYLAATLPVAATVVVTVAALPRLVAGYRVTGWAGRHDPQVTQVAAFAARGWPGALLSGAPQFALPLVAVSVLGPHENAFFYVAWSIAQIAYLVPSVVSNISLSQGTADSAGTLAARSRRFSVLLLAPVLAVCVVVPGLVLMWYGAGYEDRAATALRLLMVGVLPWTVVILSQSRLRSEHRFAQLTVLTAAFCGLSLTLPVAAGLVTRSGAAMSAGWTVAVGVTAGLALVQAARTRSGRARQTAVTRGARR